MLARGPAAPAELQRARKADRRPARRALEAAILLAAAAGFAASVTPGWEAAPRAPRGGAEPAVWARAEPPPWLLPLDDAYIFVRYAQQLARGRFLEWNAGEPSSGASSPLYLALVVPPHGWSDDLAVWSLWSRLVGLVSLWALGWAGARLLRAAGLPAPWPLAGGLALALSGPLGFGALAGMESAANAALVLAACALWAEAGRRGDGPAPAGALIATALLPLARPENLALTLAAVLAVLLGRLPAPRRWAPLLLLPAAAWAGVLLALTGEAQPAGSIAKSWLGAAFLPAGTLVRQVLLDARDLVLPIYLGRAPRLLPFPVGLLAAATAAAALAGAARSARRRALAPLAVAWCLLVAGAPLSSSLLWQQMRHHHAGLACAWALAVAGLGLLVETALARRRAGARALSTWRWVALLVPAALLPALPYWAGEHRTAARELYARDAPALAWLATHGRRQVLLVTDAGLPALVHDGPAVDTLGLGSPDLTRPYRHGPGALLESLARRRPVPAIAAVDPDLLGMPPLLGPPLVPPAPGALVLAPVQRELLAATPLRGPGVDLAHLPDEARHRLRWRLPPGTDRPSFALPRAEPGAAVSLQGCRPVFGSVGVALPAGARGGRLLFAALSPGGAGVRVFAGDARGAAGPPLAAAAVPGQGWFAVAAAWPAGHSYLWVERDGPGLPCLESLTSA